METENLNLENKKDVSENSESVPDIPEIQAKNLKAELDRKPMEPPKKLPKKSEMLAEYKKVCAIAGIPPKHDDKHILKRIKKDELWRMINEIKEPVAEDVYVVKEIKDDKTGEVKTVKKVHTSIKKTGASLFFNANILIAKGLEQVASSKEYNFGGMVKRTMSDKKHLLPTYEAMFDDYPELAKYVRPVYNALLTNAKNVVLSVGDGKNNIVKKNNSKLPIGNVGNTHPDNVVAPKIKKIRKSKSSGPPLLTKINTPLRDHQRI